MPIYIVVKDNGELTLQDLESPLDVLKTPFTRSRMLFFDRIHYTIYYLQEPDMTCPLNPKRLAFLPDIIKPDEFRVARHQYRGPMVIEKCIAPAEWNDRNSIDHLGWEDLINQITGVSKKEELVNCIEDDIYHLTHYASKIIQREEDKAADMEAGCVIL